MRRRPKVEVKTVDAKVYYRVQPCDKCGTEVRQEISERDAELLTTPPRFGIKSAWQGDLLKEKILCQRCGKEAQEAWMKEQAERQEAAHQELLRRYERIVGATVVDLRAEDGALNEVVLDKGGVLSVIVGANGYEGDDAYLEVEE